MVGCGSENKAVSNLPGLPAQRIALRFFLRKACGVGRVAGWVAAISQGEKFIQMSLGGGSQTTIELLAQASSLFTRPIDGKQDIGQFRVAQEQATVVMNKQGAKQESVLVSDLGQTIAAHFG